MVLCKLQIVFCYEQLSQVLKAKILRVLFPIPSYQDEILFLYTFFSTQIDSNVNSTSYREYAITIH